MKIRKATKSDIAEITEIYQKARVYMFEHGNPNQWNNAYPSEETVVTDIKNETSYLLEEDGVIQGVFVFVIGKEPTYQQIEQGAWNFDRPYGTIHRIASAGKIRGIAKASFDFCTKQIDYLRIDTHKDNKTMQTAIKNYGFMYCGIIHVSNGERLAFDYINTRNSKYRL